MRQLPKAIPELDGGVFLPRPVLELLEAVLIEHEQQLLQRQAESDVELAVLHELRQLLRLTGVRLPLPASRELLEMADPQAEMIGRNLLRH